MAPTGHRLLHVDEPDNDRRTVEPAPPRLRNPMVQIGHDLAYGFLVVMSARSRGVMTSLRTPARSAAVAGAAPLG
jgi:hypothetical protein